MTVLPTNHVNILCMRLYVSGRSHAQYAYMIGLGAQPRDAPGPCIISRHGIRCWCANEQKEVGLDALVFSWLDNLVFCVICECDVSINSLSFERSFVFSLYN